MLRSERPPHRKNAVLMVFVSSRLVYIFLLDVRARRRGRDGSLPVRRSLTIVDLTLVFCKYGYGTKLTDENARNETLDDTIHDARKPTW